MRSRPHAVVLGAGIQGTCTALALAAAGWCVELLDRLAEPLLGTSRRGEGKLHLGYVYANDEGRSTAALMVDGALQFSDLLDRWLPGQIDWQAIRSTPFLYGVLPGSLVPVDKLEEHYAWVDDLVAARVADGARYAGGAQFRPVRMVPCPADRSLAGDLLAVFASSEVAVAPLLLRDRMIVGLDRGDVSFHGRSTVHGVERTSTGFGVSCTDAGGKPRIHRADAVVNCLWDGRLAIDASMGIEPDRPWSYRLKYAVHGTVSPGGVIPPSTTFVLGPFGDVVYWPNGRVYASWYPACLAGWSDELTVPASWLQALGGTDAASTQADIAGDSLTALVEYIPALRDLRVDLVAAGVVVAWGAKDIGEPDSELHHRHEIGVHEHDGYLSVDTGKFTTAPLFAQQVAELVAR